MITVSLSLALCTVMFRRFMDSFTGRIPIAIQSSTAPNTTALFMFSGALYYLYNHLKKGTLVRIGQGHTRHVGHNSSRLTIQRRPKNNSWFLRNARACRKKCTDAVYRIAKQSYESLHNLNPCLLLPNKSFQISFNRVKSDSPPEQILNREDKQNFCNIIYSNEAFQKESSQEVKSTESKKACLQLPSKVMVDGEKPTGRSRRTMLKRLCDEHNKQDEEVNVSLRYPNKQLKNRKKNLKVKRMTRSGRVYSRFE